eukprot:3143562-Rhodomonas_salina.1
MLISLDAGPTQLERPEENEDAEQPTMLLSLFPAHEIIGCVRYLVNQGEEHWSVEGYTNIGIYLPMGVVQRAEDPTQAQFFFA